MSKEIAYNERDVTKVLKEELSRLAERIKQNHISAGQVASGRTLESIIYEVKEGEGSLFGRFPFGTLETGRRPGAVPESFEAIIRQWILDKGLPVQPIPYKRKPSKKWQPKYTPEERGLRTMADAIATKIRKEGTALYRNGGRNDIYSNEIPDAIQRVEERIGNLFETMIEHIHLNA